MSTRCTSLPACLSTTTKAVCTDFEKWLEKLASYSPESYTHNKTGEDNTDAHLKRQLMGREVVVAITNGQFDFGPWEQIFYGEFDGRRQKRILVKVIGELLWLYLLQLIRFNLHRILMENVNSTII